MSKKEIRFHDYDYLINKLKEKGLLIDDDLQAIELLKSVGYYNLINRYKSEFYLSGKNQYKEGIYIEDLYYYHRIEDDLRNILFQFTIKFEQRFKESLAYIISKKLGVNTDQYLNPYNSFYRHRGRSRTKNIIKKVKHILNQCDDNPTLYYKSQYGNIPPWIALSNLTFGQARMWFSRFDITISKYVMLCTLPVESKSEFELEDFIIDNLIGFNDTQAHSDEEFEEMVTGDVESLVELTRNVITIIHEFRNNLAHGSRLIHFKSKENLNLHDIRFFANNKVVTNDEYSKIHICTNDLFAFMVSLTIGMDKFDSMAFISKLEDWKTLNCKSSESKRAFNRFIQSSELPLNFIERLKNIKIEKTKKQMHDNLQRLQNY